MITVQLPAHPDFPAIKRQVVVPRLDGINYEEKTASIVIRVEHLNPDGSLHPYLGAKTDFMFTSNAKQVDAQGKLVEPGTAGAIGEFDWLHAAIEAGTGLHTLIRGLIQRNIERGNFTTGNYRN